jgi:phosphate:Na+ symporter
VGRPRWLVDSAAVLLGLGLVFFGMAVMTGAVSPLRDQPLFERMLLSGSHVAVALAAGVVFTALVQSSAATIGVVIVLASQGLLTLPTAIAVTLGANIGTCVTASLAAVGRQRVAVRAAVIHVMFNVIGVLLWLGFIDQLAAFVVWLSPVAEGVEGAARLAAETPRQVANAHTVFNLANTVVFIGLTRPLARLAELLVPVRAGEVEAREPRYLDDDVLGTPSVALELARLETVRLAERVGAMVNGIVPVMLSGSARRLRAIAEMDHDVDRLHRLIVSYLARVGREDLTQEQSEHMLQLLSVANYLEQVGDVVETNLVALGLSRIDENFRPSPASRRVVSEFHAIVRDRFQAVVEALAQDDPLLALEVRQARDQVSTVRRAALQHQADRLLAAGPGRARAYTRESEMIEHLRRIYTLTRGLTGQLVDSDAEEVRRMRDT